METKKLLDLYIKYGFRRSESSRLAKGSVAKDSNLISQEEKEKIVKELKKAVKTRKVRK